LSGFLNQSTSLSQSSQFRCFVVVGTGISQSIQRKTRNKKRERNVRGLFSPIFWKDGSFTPATLSVVIRNFTAGVSGTFSIIWLLFEIDKRSSKIQSNIERERKEEEVILKGEKGKGGKGEKGKKISAQKKSHARDVDSRTRCPFRIDHRPRSVLE
jgi:hypothetical protein